MKKFWLMAVAALLSGCGEKAQESKATVRAVPVRIATAVAAPSAPPVRTVGVIIPNDGARLSFKVGGVIAKLAPEVGAEVKAGDVLASIEQTEIGSAFERARQAAEKAKRDLERGERLYRDQVVTLEQMQDLKTAYAVAQADLRSVGFNKSYAQIVAPFDGVVLRRLAEQRELVAAGQSVLVLAPKDSGFVLRASLSDRDVVQLALGDQATLEFDAFPRQRFAARVSEIASAADEGTGMFDAKLVLENPPSSMKSGLLARLEIAPESARAQALPLLPFAAVVEGDGRSAHVFVLNNGKAEKQAVEVAYIDRTGVAIGAGIEIGATVVAEGALFVRDGDSVRVVDELSQSSASPQNSSAPNLLGG
jgi:RND family efflux transporter MFP subunit